MHIGVACGRAASSVAQQLADINSDPCLDLRLQMGAAAAAGAQRRGAAAALARLVPGDWPGHEPAPQQRLQRALRPHAGVRAPLPVQLPPRAALPGLHLALLDWLPPQATRVQAALQRAVRDVRGAVHLGVRAPGPLRPALRRALHQVGPLPGAFLGLPDAAELR